MNKNDDFNQKNDNDNINENKDIETTTDTVGEDTDTSEQTETTTENPLESSETTEEIVEESKKEKKAREKLELKEAREAKKTPVQYRKSNNNKLKYGLVSTLTTVFLVGVLIVVNLISTYRDTTIDVSRDQIYSLTDDTIEFIETLEVPINIYAVFPTDYENATIEQLLEEYESNSDMITVEYVDPVLNPGFVQKYAVNGEPVQNGSIIIENGENGKSKIIPYEQLFKYDRSSGKTSNNLESEVTNAISYVITDYESTIYVVMNHGEAALPAQLTDMFASLNFQVEYVDLTVDEIIPSTSNILFVQQPQRDWLQEEVDLVISYLEQGGNAFILAGPNVTATPVFDSLLEYYGIVIDDNIIFESDTENMIQALPTILKPDYNYESVYVDDLAQKGFYPVVDLVSSISTAEVTRSTLTFEPLLVTSDTSYAKSTSAETYNKEPGDAEGPFTIATHITDTSLVDGTQSDIVVVSTALLTATGYNQASYGANYQFITECITNMVDMEEFVYIPPKAVSSERLVITSYAQILFLTFLGIIVIPALVIIVALVVIIRRNSITKRERGKKERQAKVRKFNDIEPSIVDLTENETEVKSEIEKEEENEKEKETKNE